MAFRVDLDIFRGPMDLLLHLVKKHELEIVDIPIAPIAEQFLEHLAVLEQLDVNAVGDFLEMASILMEIKSRMVLPHAGEEPEPLDDPRQDLVRRLLEYKQFKEAASMLEEQARVWQDRFPRMVSDRPVRPREPAEEPLAELELWDLVSAFGRVIREQLTHQPTTIRYDETPIHVFMERIQDSLRRQQRLAFSTLFSPGMHRSTMVGIFLAVLELVRNHGVGAEQAEDFGEIWLAAGQASADEAPQDEASIRR